MSNEKIQILVQIYYTAGNPSLDKYLKSRKTECSKGHFPYRWLTSYNKLFETKIPPYNYVEANKTSKTEYNTLTTIWEQMNMTNMFDYLKYYNNLDVKPLVEAIESHRQFYFDYNLDMHKDAVALSGLAERIMFNNSKEQTKGKKIDTITKSIIEKEKEVTKKYDVTRLYS